MIRQGEQSSEFRTDSRDLIRKNIAAMLPRISSSSGTECLDLATATEVEALLYKDSPTLNEYMDQTTLRFRVEMLLPRQRINETVNCAQNIANLPTLVDTKKRQRLAARPQKGRRPHLEEPIPCPKRRRAENRGFTLTAQYIREHLSGLRPPECPSAEENSNQSVCSLCGLGKLPLAPVPRYCSCCGTVVKCGVNYYRTAEQDSEKHNFCLWCFKHSRGSVAFGGQRFLKKTLVTVRNIEEREELWVQCDECKELHHQICGLFNDMVGKYKCPKCRLKAMESEEYTPGSDGAVFVTAKDLPETILGNYIQTRLLRRLSRDREDRAKAAGKSLEEVPGAEDVWVRVVLSMKKKVAVNKEVLSVVEDDNYPTEFPYTTKMIIIFQKIAGVDVCLFVMYVQEYGSDCPGPNHRYAYISYIDSAKYFTPDIAAATGEALRTVAYQEALISYLDFVKKRGFATCYLWSCPPLRGDQYILNCHPKNQKTPNPDRLRKWYQKLVRKAAKEGIVVNSTTLYDRFFDQTGMAPGRKITVGRLPYLEGDYWPGVVESLLREMEKESNEKAKKGMKRAVTKTCLKVLGLTNPCDATNKNFRLMQKLGQTIFSCKEDFMVIDLHYVCTHCRDPILSGNRWLCAGTKNSYKCQRCHHLSGDDDDSVSQFEVVDDVPGETKDEDGTLENDICESRNKFLKFCQEKRYQFDTLRRTKHSSMMILHHILPTVRTKIALPEDERSKLMEIVRHVSGCRAEEGSACGFLGCGKIQGMFVHASKCNIRAEGGCLPCQKVGYTLRSHSEQCSQPDCRIPNCKMLRKK